MPGEPHRAQRRVRPPPAAATRLVLRPTRTVCRANAVRHGYMHRATMGAPATDPPAASRPARGSRPARRWDEADRPVLLAAQCPRGGVGDRVARQHDRHILSQAGRALPGPLWTESAQEVDHRVRPTFDRAAGLVVVVDSDSWRPGSTPSPAEPPPSRPSTGRRWRRTAARCGFLDMPGTAGGVPKVRLACPVWQSARR
jgi:hypothetical protein